MRRIKQKLPTINEKRDTTAGANKSPPRQTTQGSINNMISTLQVTNTPKEGSQATRQLTLICTTTIRHCAHLSEGFVCEFAPPGSISLLAHPQSTAEPVHPGGPRSVCPAALLTLLTRFELNGHKQQEGLTHLTDATGSCERRKSPGRAAMSVPARSHTPQQQQRGVP